MTSDFNSSSDFRPAQYALSVHPSVIFKLGEDLITDDIQALTELIKNAYDADSSSATVVVDTEIWTDLQSGEIIEDGEAERQSSARDDILLALAQIENFIREEMAAELPSSNALLPRRELIEQKDTLTAQLSQLPEPIQGRITVSDRGTGMTVEQIVKGWLTVSSSSKRGMKARGEKTGRLRTPLGDKGLGRLGAQRLGRVLDLTTTPRSSPAGEESKQTSAEVLSVAIDWDRFLTVDALSVVPISIKSSTSRNPKFGSRVEIRGLTNREFWLASRNDELELHLATMISPYGENRGFKVQIVINGESSDLGERSAKVLDNSMVSYILDYSDGLLDISASASIDYFRNPQSRADSAVWQELLEPDNGGAFLKWILENEPSRASEIGLEEGDDRHFAKFSGRISLATPTGFDVRKARTTAEVERDELGQPIDFGPFSGRVDQVPLRTNSQSVFDSRKEYREFVRVLSGIRVYRDGFGIRLARDWLDLAEQWSGAGSWYTLKPENVIGHIDLTAEHNSALEETSAREDFRDVPAYRNFMKLLGEWLAFTEHAQEFLRRSYLAYRKVRLAHSDGLDARSTPDQLARRVENQLAAIKNVQTSSESARKSAASASAAVQELNDQRSYLTNSLLADPESLRSYDKAVKSASEALARVEEAASLISREAEQASDSKAALELLMGQLRESQEQVRQVWEVVSLGLTAESVAHEVGNVTERLKSRSGQIERHVKASSKDERVLAFVEAVRSSATTLAQQVSHLDSSLHYARDRRERRGLSTILGETIQYFDSRWKHLPLSIELDVRHDIVAKFSRGKLSQVFDNLILNSQYWLEQEVAAGRATSGIVYIEVDAPMVVISDSGPGIDVSVESSLFDPFVTRKPARRGRGLGLFVVQQLLDSEGVRISLSPKRNAGGRLYQFQLDFSNQAE